MYINRRADLENLFRRFETMDLQHYITGNPADSKWRPALLTNAKWDVYRLPPYLLGKQCQLPDYIKKKNAL